MLIEPPAVHRTVSLDAENPVVRMNALQSGIGALRISGAERMAWEDVDDHSGVVHTDGRAFGDDVPLLGNRSLLRPLDGGVIVSLRHVRALRRLLVDAPANSVLALVPYCTGTVRAADPAHRVRVSVVVVNGRLEIRAEYGLPDEWGAALSAMGWSDLATIPRGAPAVWL